MVEFCPKCSNLLRIISEDGKKLFACKCGYQMEIEENIEEIEKEIKKKKKALDKNFIIVSNEDKISLHPIVLKICPKCGYKEAEAWQVQTRSADEPSTSFFRCVKCKQTWREY